MLHQTWLSLQAVALRHVPCIAHAIYLVAKKSLDQSPGLEDLGTRAWKQPQRSWRMCSNKWLAEWWSRSRRWTRSGTSPSWGCSTFIMRGRQWEQLLWMEVNRLSTEDYDMIAACLQVLKPFYMATVEMSQVSRWVITDKNVPSHMPYWANLLGQNMYASLTNSPSQLSALCAAHTLNTSTDHPSTSKSTSAVPYVQNSSSTGNVLVHN